MNPLGAWRSAVPKGILDLPIEQVDAGAACVVELNPLVV